MKGNEAILGKGDLWGNNLNRVFRERPPWRHLHEVREQAKWIWQEANSDWGNSKFKSPETGTNLGSWKIMKGTLWLKWNKPETNSRAWVCRGWWCQIMKALNNKGFRSFFYRWWEATKSFWAGKWHDLIYILKGWL